MLCTKSKKNTTYPKLKFLLTQLIYARTKLCKVLELITSEGSPSLPQGMEHVSAFLNLLLPDTYMTNDCVSITQTLVMGVKLMTGTYDKILT